MNGVWKAVSLLYIKHNFMYSSKYNRREDLLDHRSVTLSDVPLLRMVLGLDDPCQNVYVL